MASLKKRGKTYYAQYYLNGRQQRINLETTSLQIAKEKLRMIESAQFRQQDIPLPTKTPLPVIIEKYIFSLKARTSERNLQKIITYLRATFGQVSPSLTIRNGRIATKAVKKPAYGRYDLLCVASLEQLSPELVAAFLATLVVHKGISTTTVNHYRQILLTFCNWAMTEGGVRFPGDKNPVATVKRYRQHKSDIRFLKKDEITQQLDALSGDLMLQTMVAVYIYAGLRREEALWLMPQDFDWDAGTHGTIRIRDKEFNGTKWLPKTRSNRTVPISATLRRYLDTYRHTASCTDWFFHTPNGCRWDVDNFSDHLRRANKAAGLAWSCLDYRHTFGSHLAMKGESLYKISKIMGNSPQVCEKHYAALLPECLFASVEFEHEPPTAAVVPPAPVTREPADERPMLRLVVNNG